MKSLSSDLILLNKQSISDFLFSYQFASPFNLHIITSVDSTNRYLKDVPIGSAIEICCAELQTQGRGRFGRQWHSPFGENIYCSSRWNLNCDLSKLQGLSLITSLAVLATLKEIHPNPDIKIKWPNDILWGNKKLCGSLIEVVAKSKTSAEVIIGIGLNVNTDTKNHPLSDKPWCSLYEILQQNYNRNQIVAKLIINLESYIKKFINNEFNTFMEEWNRSDYLVGKHISVIQAMNSISGVARGINLLGQLILEGEDNKIHFLCSGDTTLHSFYQSDK